MAHPSSSHSRFHVLNVLLWGNTVALSWVWGLGLFFSVQFTVEFGLTGLLTVPIPPSPRPRSIRTEVPSDGPAFTLTSPAESNKQHHGARPLRLPSRARV